MKKTNSKIETQKFLDGAYANALTGLGMLKNDKTAHTRANPATLAQNDVELAMMYMQDGLATTIASAHPETALADDIKITNDESGEILKAMEAIGFSEAVIEAGTMARLFGGAAIMTLYDGNSSFEEEPRADEKIVGYKVFASSDFRIGNESFVTERSSKYYNEIELFKVNLDNGKEVYIHTSRLTLFHNKKAPRILQNIPFNQKFFGCSSVKEVEDAIKDLGSTMGSVANMMTENGLKVFSLSGLTQMLSRPDSGVKSVNERMSVVNMALSSYRSIFQDKDDDFKMVSHSFGGIPDVIRLMMVIACAKSKIPMSILFGQTITGLSGTNDGDIKTFNSDVNSWRKKVLYRPMCSLVTDFCNRNMAKPGLYDFTFAPLGTLTEKEYVEAKKIQAETCEKFFNMGAITSAEIRKCALENGGTFELSVEGDLNITNTANEDISDEE